MNGPSFEPLFARVAAHFLPRLPHRLVIGVSGGSDSLALLCILADWAAQGGPEVEAVSVDHGLRPSSGDEARTVAAVCADLGVRHTTLRWQGWDGQGNLQDAARNARYRLLADFTRAQGGADLVVAHTADDQAETVLMRLARGAGVDGLSAMRPTRRLWGVTLHRPALGIRRAELRADLKARGLTWIDDPTNDDTRYTRIKMRALLPALEDAGLSVEALARVAENMQDAREALDWHTFIDASEITSIDGGDVVIDRRGFRMLRREMARRLMRAGIVWITGDPYPPRGRALDLLIEAGTSGTGMTLQGVRLLPEDARLRLTRELNAAGPAVPVGEVWDGRWHLSADALAPWVTEGAQIGPLGEAGLSQCEGWRDTGRPAAALEASPAVWKGELLVAAPLAGLSNGWEAHLTRPAEAFASSIVSQ